MSWARLDDGYPWHPKVVGLSDAAFRLHVTAICYCTGKLTDGLVPAPALRFMGATKKAIAELVMAGLWDEADGSYALHDYLEYNPTREEVEAAREQRRAAGQSSGAARRTKRERVVQRKPNESFERAVQRDGERKPNNILVPVPIPSDDSLRSSSAAGDDDLPQEVREKRDVLLMRIPRRFQDDWLTRDECGQLAREFELDALVTAQEACRRDNRLPFPGNLREYLTPKEARNGRDAANRGLDPIVAELYATGKLRAE